MENALYDFYSLVDTYQKTFPFAAPTRSFSNTTQLVNKNHACARIFHEVIFIHASANAKNMLKVGFLPRDYRRSHTLNAKWLFQCP